MGKLQQMDLRINIKELKVDDKVSIIGTKGYWKVAKVDLVHNLVLVYRNDIFKPSRRFMTKKVHKDKLINYNPIKNGA